MERRTSGRTSKAPRPHGREVRAIDGDRQQRAYDSIKREILDAKYAAGTALSAYVLAREIGVSRTPVREALKRLQQEGLVRSIARRGTFVSDLSLQDIIEIYEVREQLETFAAAAAATRMDRSVAKRLRARIDEVRRAPQARRAVLARQEDVELHKELISSTANRRLGGILATLDDQVHRIRALALADDARITATIREHAAIVDAILRGNSRVAGAAMKSHLRIARENAVRLALGGRDLNGG